VSTTEVSATPDQEGIARAAGSVTVSMGDNFYSPASVSIDIGDTVTWTNGGQAQHSATATDGSFDTGVFGPGGSRSNTFTQAGTFNYFCTVHGNAQSGTVTVASASGGGDGPSEADAVASGGAGGSSTGLPASGSNALPPLVVGLLLLAAGLAIRLRARPGAA
jgi:plastocyanin